MGGSPTVALSELGEPQRARAPRLPTSWGWGCRGRPKLSQTRQEPNHCLQATTARGDDAFERSRAKAWAALEKLQSELKRRSTAEELVQTIHEIRTGSRVESIPLNDAAARWLALPRRRPLSKRYVDQAESWMKRFVEFLATNHSTLRDLDQVQPAMARAFLKAEEERGVSGKTYNNILIFLRSCFEALKDQAGIAKNPFTGIPTKEEDTVFRKPFTVEELAAILTAAKANKFIYPIIVTGICTAMRRGDCCQLLKTAVDLPNKFIKVKTSKTGELVQIPIFPLFQEMLEKLEPNDGPFVFPEQANVYVLNPDHITLQVRKVNRRLPQHRRSLRLNRRPLLVPRRRHLRPPLCLSSRFL